MCVGAEERKNRNKNDMRMRIRIEKLQCCNDLRVQICSCSVGMVERYLRFCD